MPPLGNEIVSSVDRLCRVPAGEGMVVGVSGGLDSRVLLGVLERLARQRAWRLVVAHFNHQLRGDAADEDEQFVRRLAARLGLEYARSAADVRAAARTRKVSLEMAARELRHSFLAATARARGLRTVALAHHADDQRELFWIRLLRGCGPAALAGMQHDSPSPADPSIRLVRPLLAFNRNQLLALARQSRWRWREDASNARPDALRNRVRHQLIPLLKRQYQPGIDEVVSRLMEMVRCETASAGADFNDPGGSALPVQAGAACSAAGQRRRIVAALRQLGVSPEFRVVESLRLQPSTPVTVAGGRRLHRGAEGELCDVPSESAAFPRERLTLDLRDPQGTCVFGTCRVRWKVRGITPADRPRPRTRQRMECFDARCVGDTVVLRHWQPGDRFWPIGMGKPMKLQDYFVNRRIPAGERRRRVVAEDASGRLFWIQGERITGKTRRVLEWCWTVGD